MGNVVVIEKEFQSYEQEFSEVVISNDINFKQEALFALQQLSKGGKDGKKSFVMRIAEGNPSSLKFAIMNVGSIGVSLSPAKRQAYLVPRNGEIVLDVSYMGLCYLAQVSGALKWVQAEIVRKKDRYIYKGKFEKPIHEFDPFSDRGPIIGTYCVAFTGTSYLVEVMTISDVYKIRERSDGYAKESMRKYSPWETDEEEMIKKTVVKRAAKMWPVTEDSRLANAIEVINQHQGINFENEEESIHASQETLKKIRDILVIMRKDETKFCAHLVNIIDGCPPDLECLTNLTEKHAKYALESLMDIYNKHRDGPPKEEIKKEEKEINPDDIEVEF